MIGAFDPSKGLFVYFKRGRSIIVNRIIVWL